MLEKAATAMRWIHQTRGDVRRLGILAGAFNPVTCAHLALARAALPVVEQILFVLPETLPHKEFSGASREQREAMLQAVCQTEPRFAAATTAGGLLAEIAAEVRAACEPPLQLFFLLGRDAAERIVTWRYADPGDLPRFLRECSLLVAPRGGLYQPPAEYAGAILQLELAEEWNEVSASEIRRRVQAGEAWEQLVPQAISDEVRSIYS